MLLPTYISEVLQLAKITDKDRTSNESVHFKFQKTTTTNKPKVKTIDHNK